MGVEPQMMRKALRRAKRKRLSGGSEWKAINAPRYDLSTPVPNECPHHPHQRLVATPYEQMRFVDFFQQGVPSVYVLKS